MKSAVIAFLSAASFAVLMLLAKEAHARDPDIRLTLQVADEFTPTHVCVISGADDPRRASVTTGGSDRGRRLSSTLHHLMDSKQLTTWPPRTPMKDADEFVLHLSDDTDEARAFGNLDWQNDAHVKACAFSGSDDSLCVPSLNLERFPVEKRTKLFAHCAENAGVQRREDQSRKKARKRGEGDPAVNRILFLALTAQQIENVAVADIDIDGKHVLVRVSRSTGVDYTFNVLGGFFAPVGEVHVNSEAPSDSLVLEPRCLWKEIAAPPGTTNGRVTFEAEGGSNPRKAAGVCQELRQTGGLRVLLPYVSSGRARLVIASTESDRPGPGWALEASWHSPRPPGAADTPLQLGVTTLGFSWSPSACLRPPTAVCPEVEIAAGNVPCSLAPATGAAGAGPPGLCHYTCGSSSATKQIIDFPTTVTFSTRDADSTKNDQFPKWSASITEMGAIVQADVAASERVLRLDVEPWIEPRIEGKEQAKEARRFPCELRLGHERRDACFTKVPGLRAAVEEAEEQAATMHGWTDEATKQHARRNEQKHLRDVACRDKRGRRDDVFFIEFSTPYDKARRLPIHGILGCEHNRSSPSQPSQPTSAAPNGTAPTTGAGDPGATPFVAAGGNLVVKLPHTTCRDTVTLRYVGERDYYPVTARPVGGTLRLPHPMASARMVYFELGVYPASALVPLAPRDLNTRASGVPFSPAMDLSLAFKPRTDAARGMRFAIAATFTGGARPYLGVDDSPGDTRLVTSLDRTLYARLYLGGDILSSWLGKRSQARAGIAAALGGGLQVGIGFPLAQREVTRLGGIDWGLLALRGHLRVRFSKHVEGAFSPRLLLAEKVHSFATDLRGQPTANESRKGVAWLLPLGVVLVW